MHRLPIPSPAQDREAHYDSAWPGLEALLSAAPDVIAAMANTAAVLHATLGMHWTGFYRVMGNDLLLGPFQGPPACERIAYGKGVCGSAWLQDRTLVVPDVALFPGHIACSALSRSEIVVPVRNGRGQVVAVLDIDSVEPDDFSSIDAWHLERICALLGTHA